MKSSFPITLTILTWIVLSDVQLSWEDNISDFNGLCTSVGFIADPDDPRKFYQCKLSRDNTFQYKSLKCNRDDVWNQEKSQCVQANSSINYQCLKQNLDTDASRNCFEETLDILSKGTSGFIDAAAHRGDPVNNFRLSVRDIHLNMRENYGKLIASVGQNMYPLIVATDSDTPDLSGVGGAYKVYFRNGTMRRIVPVGPEFEIYKALSHMVLGVFAIVSPYFRSPESINWKPKLQELSGKISDASYSLTGSGLPLPEKLNIKKMFEIVNNYIETSLKTNSVPYQSFAKLGKEISPYIDQNMKIAAKAHVSATIPALQQLKAEMGEEEWKKLYVIIPTVWPVSMYNIRLQVFRKVMDFKQIKQQVLIVEGAKSEDDARTTLGRIVGDRALAQLVFGGQEQDSFKDHAFSLSTRRDILSTIDEEALDSWCRGDSGDYSSSPVSETKVPRCPMSKHFATMLRQAP